MPLPQIELPIVCTAWFDSYLFSELYFTSNILSLGYFQSGLMKKISAESQEQMKKEIPSGKFGDIRNIAHAIEFLIKSEYSNGAVINIDGGI